MILAALLLPIAVVVLVLLVQRFGLPAFLALAAVVVGYGIAADMTFQSIGKAFGLGFSTALEQVGLLVMAGAMVGILAIGQPLRWPLAASAGVLAGLGGTAAGGLALLQPAGIGAPRRAIGLAMTLLIVHALVVPSPLAVAAAAVLNADLRTMASVAIPAAAIAALLIWLLVVWLPGTHGEPSRGPMPLAWLAIAIPIALLVFQSIAQMPNEPLGKGGSREFYIGISRPLILAMLAISLALVLSRRWQPEVLADTRWAPLMLTVGAAGGFARVLDETGMAELLAEQIADPRLGLAAPFLAAATVKTLQGNSLSAVLTASGIIEPMLPALGLDSPTGRALAAASAGAGSIAICHVNDPFFWIAAHMAGLTPLRALSVLSIGSLAVAVAALLVLVGLRLAL